MSRFRERRRTQLGTLPVIAGILLASMVITSPAQAARPHSSSLSSSSSSSSAPVTGTRSPDRQHQHEQAPQKHRELDGLEPQSRHRITLLARTSLALHLSDARTAGGLGGGVGIRDVVGDYFVMQGDIAWLTQLGNVLAIRAGAGIQKPGTWSPAALIAVTGMLGSQLTFPAEGRPASSGPALSIGLVLAPLRFVTDKAEVSILEIGVGIGAETPGFATAISIGFEVGAQLF